MNRFSLLLRNHKLVFPLTAVPILIVSAFSGSRQPQESKKDDPVRPKRMKIVVQVQPNAPLAIASASNRSADPNTPSITVKLVNTTSSLVRAFTVRCDTHFGESMLSAWSLNNILSVENCFKPQETKTESIDDANYSQPPQSAVLSIDFVEFMDGSRWGEDGYKSGERLDGWRAGAHLEVESILTKIRIDGLELALNEVRSKSSAVAVASSVSAEYADGFRHGVGAMRARVLHSEGKNKLDEIVNELRRPIDLSDWR